MRHSIAPSTRLPAEAHSPYDLSLGISSSTMLQPLLIVCDTSSKSSSVLVSDGRPLNVAGVGLACERPRAERRAA